MTRDPRVRELLQELLDSGSTPAEVCRSCPELLTQVRIGWQRVRAVEAEVEDLLPEVIPEDSIRPTNIVPGPQSTDELPQVRGYEVQGVLGRGGVGIVYKAHHARLNRTVALKMLLAGPYARPEELERFLREAKAVGALRHPNVVQVYDVGDAGGRPYFTMELVEGGSLAQKLAGAPLPARQAVALVATVADAVQAAHAQGVVHRDLKPANVLLTSDGTPKVTDFGLARRLEGGGGLTLSGVPIGTPSYMAPEQALGQKEAIAPATDVYALGAILYELLTGRPPFRGETPAATMYQVMGQDPVPPSRLNYKVPRDLETICLKSLDKEPKRRYPSAAALSEDLRRFALGEPITARPIGAAESLWKWVRRRPATAGVVAAGALFVAAGATGAWLLYQQRIDALAHQTKTDREVCQVLERGRGLLEEGWRNADQAQVKQAQSEADRAADIARRGEAGASIRREAEALQQDAARRLERVGRDRALLEALQDVSVRNETRARVFGRENLTVKLALPSANELYGAAFRRWGLDVDGTAEEELARRLGEEPAPVVRELVACLDWWMLERRNQPEADWRRLYRVAERLDGSELRQRIRSLLVGGAQPRLEAVTGLAAFGSPSPVPWGLAHWGTWRAFQELRRSIDPRTETIQTVTLLASAFAEVGDAAEGERILRQAVTARPDQVVLLAALGRLMELQGPSRLTDAIGYYRAARGRNPQLGLALGRVLQAAGKLDEAEEVLQELARQPAHNHDTALFLNLSDTLYSRRKYIEAEAASRKAAHIQPDLAEAHYNLGTALMAQKRYGEAEAAYRKAVNLKPRFVEAYNNLGSALMAQKRYGEAEAAFRKAIDLKPRFVEAYNNLGAALMGQQRYGESEAAFRKAIDLRPDFAEAFNNLSYSLVHQGRHGEAEAASREAINFKPSLAEAYQNLGTALSAQAKLRDAEAAYRKAVELKPDYAEAYYYLGNVLMEQRRHREAEAVFRKAVEHSPDYAQAYTNLGSALVRQGRHIEAETALRKALKLNPGLDEAYQNLGIALMCQARFDIADAALKKASDLLPATHPRRFQLWMLQQQCERYKVQHANGPAGRSK
jgi:serine/threonine-protein kinase